VASEPPEQKNTRFSDPGAMADNREARSSAALVDHASLCT